MRICTSAACRIFVGFAFSCTLALAQTIPARLSECETYGCGGDWRFNDRKGTAHWPNGAEAELTVERWDQDQVIIRRKDISAQTLGATAVYTGKINGNRIEGEATYTWPGHWGNKPVVVQWNAVINDEPVPGEPKAPAESAPKASASVRGQVPDLNGIWKLLGPQPVANLAFAVVQQGTDLTVFKIQPGEPFPTYRGQFDSNNLISGHSCAPGSNPDNPDCLPETATTTVLSPSHLKDSFGAELEKIGGPEDPRFGQALALAKSLNARPYLPEKPFNIAGIWQSEEQGGPFGRINVTQDGAQVAMSYVSVSGTLFTGRYEKNPGFAGTGKSRTSLSKDVPWSVFMDDPDHFRINTEGVSHAFFRVSQPASHDLPCDPQNRYHVSRFHAFTRGHVAIKDKDEDAARCWLSISANQGFSPAQSEFAAFLIRCSKPDNDLAFKMAVMSARQDDIGGMLMLAQLFREGKGTLPDLVKARYWQQQAERSEEMKVWRTWTTPMFGGVSALDMAGAVIDFTNSMMNNGNVSNYCLWWNRHSGGLACPQ